MLFAARSSRQQPQPPPPQQQQQPPPQRRRRARRRSRCRRGRELRLCPAERGRAPPLRAGEGAAGAGSPEAALRRVTEAAEDARRGRGASRGCGGHPGETRGDLRAGNWAREDQGTGEDAENRGRGGQEARPEPSPGRRRRSPRFSEPAGAVLSGRRRGRRGR